MVCKDTMTNNLVTWCTFTCLCLSLTIPSIYYLGLKQEAKWYLSKFSWGHSFIDLNETLLDKYAECKDSKEVLEAQNEYIKNAEEERNERRAESMYPPESSSSSAAEEEEDDDTANENTDKAVKL